MEQLLLSIAAGSQLLDLAILIRFVVASSFIVACGSMVMTILYVADHNSLNQSNHFNLQFLRITYFDMSSDTAFLKRGSTIYDHISNIYYANYWHVLK